MLTTTKLCIHQIINSEIMEAKRSLRALRVVAWLGSQQRDISKAIKSKLPMQEEYSL